MSGVFILFIMAAFVFFSGWLLRAILFLLFDLGMPSGKNEGYTYIDKSVHYHTHQKLTIVDKDGAARTIENESTTTSSESGR